MFEKIKFTIEDYCRIAISNDYLLFKEKFNKMLNETDMIKNNTNTNNFNLLLRTKPRNVIDNN